MKFTILIKLFAFGLLLKCMSLDISTSDNYKSQYKMLLLLNNLADFDGSLTTFDFKNVVLGKEEIAFFKSNNPGNEELDTEINTVSYLYTMKYNYINLDCLEGLSVCTFEGLIKDKQKGHSEIGIEYKIPKKITEKFGDENKARTSCLVLSMGPHKSTEEMVWLCHENQETLKDFQMRVSKIVRLGIQTPYVSGGIDYVKDNVKRIPGTLEITSSKLTFNDDSKKAIVNLEFDKLHYAISRISKEELIWKGEEKDKPDLARCLKLVEETEQKTVHIFCVFFERTDSLRKTEMPLTLAQLSKESLSSKINLRIQAFKLQIVLKLIKEGKELNSKNSVPLRIEVRERFLFQRHFIIEFVMIGKIKETEYMTILEKEKLDIFNSVCLKDERCVKFVMEMEQFGQIPLESQKHKIAMNKENPFLLIMPKVPYNLIGVGGNSQIEKAIENLDKVVGGENKIKYLPESAPGDIPNRTSLVKTLNTIRKLREKKEYKTVEEFEKTCKLTDKNQSSMLRKIQLLSFGEDEEIFFSYLGAMGNLQK